MAARKKAAIVTIYGEFNYGNRLQNYAVAHALDRLGYEAETIVAVPRVPMKLRVKRWLRVFLGRALAPIMLRIKPHLVREARFCRFTKRHIATRYISSPDGRLPDTIAGEYDMFFTGSDQVFNPCFGGYERCFDAMLLTFVPKAKKRCVSPSFGISQMPEEWCAPFAAALDDFSSLNVREEAGAGIIRALIGREATVTIDPTLMLDAAEWMAVAQPVCVPDAYVLDYFLGSTPTGDAAYVAAREGCERVRLLDPSSRRIFVSGPGEFVYLVSHAMTVCTDSFHACVFSILFGKPFIVYAREDGNRDMLSRIETLLSLFGKTLAECLGRPTYIEPELRDAVLAKKRKELEACLL